MRLTKDRITRDKHTSFLFYFIFSSFSFVFFFLGLHLRHIEVPRLGVKSELQLMAYITATVGSFNPLIQARDGTRILMHTSQVCYHRATMGTPSQQVFNACIMDTYTWEYIVMSNSKWGLEPDFL